MDEITSRVPEPVPPELAAIDQALSDALRVPPLDRRDAELLAQAIVRRSEGDILSRTSRPGGLSNPLVRHTAWSRLGWFAAAVTAIGIAFFAGKSPSSQQANPSRVYATGAGERAVVTLEEGTQVMLAPQSRLDVVNSSSNAKVVRLEGEAYFIVAHAVKAPFIVQSGNVQTRVLGTEFLVRHIGTTADTRVSVVDGKVAIASRIHPDRGVVLSGGETGALTDSTTHVSTADEFAPGAEWIHGQLVFHHTPVVMVLAAVTRWYGYKFNCTDSALLQRPITIALSVRSSAEALAVIEQVLSVNVNVTGDTATLIPLPARPAKGTPRMRTYDVWTPTREVGR